MSAFTLDRLERRSETDGLGGERTGFDALITLGDGSTLGLSRLDGETSWVADSYFGPGGYPHWCHGYGVRYVLLHTVSDPVIVAALDAAADAL